MNDKRTEILKRKKMFSCIHIDAIIKIVHKAGEKVMKIYKKKFYIEYKEDQSPLTEADKISNEIICKNLERLYPNIPILSEENKETPYSIRKNWEYYWCIDPIDGTKEFIKKNDEFTINIALIYKNTPILGVVYAPAIGKMYSAKKNEGAFVNGEKLPLTKRKEGFIIVASKSHLSVETQNFINELKEHYNNLKTDSKGSSLKLCMVAEHSADIYPRIAPTMEWDTAAADAIVREAGKMTYQYDENIPASEYLHKHLFLKPLVYNKENLLNPNFVVA